VSQCLLQRLGHLFKQVLIFLGLNLVLLEKLLRRLVGLVLDVLFINGLDDYAVGDAFAGGEAAAIVLYDTGDVG
jgi:hypothetical protein